MKRVFLFFVWVFLSVTPILAQEATTAQSTSSDVLEKSLLWEVTGNGLEAPSYVYGTIHMIGKKDFFLTQATEAAMDKAEVFTFEIDMEDMNDMGKIMPLMMKAFMEGDTTLSDLLTDEEYKIVSDHFKKVGLPLMMLERIKPMFLSAMTGEDMMMPGQEGEGSMVSYEFEIMKVAQEREKPIEGLETMEFQMSLFDKIPYRDQAQMLVESIEAPADSSASTQLDQLVQTYKDQDIDAMVSMMDDDAGMGKYEDILLVSRNKNWIPAMEKMMKANPTFFAVGAGHLGGENGVVRLLRKAGYTLKPMY